MLQLFPLMVGAQRHSHQYLAATQTAGHQEYPEECPHQRWHKEANGAAGKGQRAWPEMQAIVPVPGAQDCLGLRDLL